MTGVATAQVRPGGRPPCVHVALEASDYLAPGFALLAAAFAPPATRTIPGWPRPTCASAAGRWSSSPRRPPAARSSTSSRTDCAGRPTRPPTPDTTTVGQWPRHGAAAPAPHARHKAAATRRNLTRRETPRGAQARSVTIRQPGLPHLCLGPRGPFGPYGGDQRPTEGTQQAQQLRPTRPPRSACPDRGQGDHASPVAQTAIDRRVGGRGCSAGRRSASAPKIWHSLPQGCPLRYGHSAATRIRPHCVPQVKRERPERGS